MPLTAIMIREPCVSAHYSKLDIVSRANVAFARSTVQITIVNEEVFQHQSLRKEREGGF